MSFKFNRKSQKYYLFWYRFLVLFFNLKSISLFEFSRLVSKYHLSDIMCVNSVAVHGKSGLWYRHLTFRLHAFYPSTTELHPPHVAELQRCIVPSFAIFIYVCFLTPWQSYFQYLGCTVMIPGIQIFIGHVLLTDFRGWKQKTMSYSSLHF